MSKICRNAHSAGRAKCQCKACGYQGYFQPSAAEKARRYAQVDQRLLERNPLCSIARATCVARNTIAEWVKKTRQSAPPPPRLRPKKAQCWRCEALECDELRTFVGHKQRKVWLWSAVDRASQHAPRLGC